MSLVEARQRRLIAVDFKRSTAAEEASRVPDVSTFMARVFGEPPIEARQVENLAAPPRTFEVAFDVLKRGAEALGELQDRCERLQSEIDSVKEEARLDREASEKARMEWQQLATAMKEKLDETQGQLGETRNALLAAQEQVNTVTQRAEVAERRAGSMEKVATALYDDILSAFGDFSKARSVLN